MYKHLVTPPVSAKLQPHDLLEGKYYFDPNEVMAAYLSASRLRHNFNQTVDHVYFAMMISSDYTQSQALLDMNQHFGDRATQTLTDLINNESRYAPTKKAKNKSALKTLPDRQICSLNVFKVIKREKAKLHHDLEELKKQGLLKPVSF